MGDSFTSLDPSSLDVSPIGGDTGYGGIDVSIPPPAPPPSFSTGDIGMATSDNALLAAGIFPDSTGILGSGSPDVSSSPNGASASGFLSGLGDVFQGIGQGVGAGITASNLPSVPRAGSGWVFNPTTGTYYNPTTGQTMTATGTITSLGGLGAGLTGNSGIILIVILAAAAFFLFRGRSAE